MIVAVASGKGGTGKTTVSVNMARAMESPVLLLDCDVEEPNCNLFLGGERTSGETVSIPIPEVDEGACKHHGDCQRICEYNAILSLPTSTMVFPDLCHGCGGCTLACPEKAIREVEKRVGVINRISAGRINLVEGRLDVGVALATPVIRELKKFIVKDHSVILDAPPGTSCPVVSTIQGCDFVVLVTEPTPFGLNDLALAVDMVRETGVPFGVVVNRMGIGDNRVHEFCRSQAIPIMLEIADDRRIAEAYSKGMLVVDALPEYSEVFRNLWDDIRASVENAPSAMDVNLSEEEPNG